MNKQKFLEEVKGRWPTIYTTDEYAGQWYLWTGQEDFDQNIHAAVFADGQEWDEVNKWRNKPVREEYLNITWKT